MKLKLWQKIRESNGWFNGIFFLWDIFSFFHTLLCTVWKNEKYCHCVVEMRTKSRSRFLRKNQHFIRQINVFLQKLAVIFTEKLWAWLRFSFPHWKLLGFQSCWVLQKRKLLEHINKCLTIDIKYRSNGFLLWVLQFLQSLFANRHASRVKDFNTPQIFDVKTASPCSNCNFVLLP